MSASGIDILGLGISTIDDLLMVEHLPRPNHKQPILAKTRQAGGLTGSALVAAARLGCRCAYAITLGEGELSIFLRHELSREGISLIERPDHPDAEPWHSLIITEKGSGERSILWDGRNVYPPIIGEAEKKLAAEVGCLFVDHVFAEHLVEIAHIARRSGTPVVGDFERTTPRSRELMDLVDHLILPFGYARQLFGESATPESSVGILARHSGRILACVTDGERGSWYALGENPDRVFHQPMFRMPSVVDSTGCGDVFHGAYAAGVIRGWPAAERIRRATASAALKTQKQGAQAGAPSLSALEAFLAIAE